MTPAIQIENISKTYRIGTKSRGYRTLRESIQEGPARLWRRLRTGVGSAPGREVAGDDRFEALAEVSFEVGRGEIVGIIGRNGAGKSTLLKILSRITEPTSGRAILDGRVGSLLEVGTGFHPELTGRENVFLNGALLGMSRREITSKFDEIVSFAGIETFLETPVKRYSSGMYVRLAFAVAAHLETEILIVDEVLAVGDSEFQKKCLRKMNSVTRSGRTVLFVSHNLAAVQNLCHRVALLHQGRLERIGRCGEVIDAYLGGGADGSRGEESLDSYRATGSRKIMREVGVRNSDGSRAAQFMSGGDLDIEIRYDTPMPLTNPVVGILVETLAGERICYLQSLSQHGPLQALPTRGTITCRVPRLPLAAGSYALSFYLSDRHVDGELDGLERVLTLDVEQGDYFGTGYLPPTSTGPVLVNAEWSFDPATGGDETPMLPRDVADLALSVLAEGSPDGH
jgi:lipopolysaccharide transport system ATP-binding protein